MSPQTSDLPTRRQLEKRLHESGESERIRELLVQKLQETGWNRKVSKLRQSVLYKNKFNSFLRKLVCRFKKKREK